MDRLKAVGKLQSNTLKHSVRLCAELKEILFIIFALFFVAGLIVLRFRFIKDRNPNTELLIDLLRVRSKITW